MFQTRASLLERLRVQGDPESWSTFVELYAPLVHRWLAEFGLQHADACDLGQEILATVVRQIPNFRYDPQRGSFRSWLRAVMTNHLRGFWRSRQTLPATLNSDWQNRLNELEDPASAVSLRWDHEYDGHLVNRILSILKSDFEPTTWQAFWRVVVDGEKTVDVAAHLGITPNAVRLAKTRVLRRLRQESHGLFD